MHRNIILALAASLATCALLPRPAVACGGLFCNASNLDPVEQDRERILFEVDPTGFISATVEIRYAGAPEDFVWVIPVPGTPEVEVVPSSTLAILDTLTAPMLTGSVPWTPPGTSPPPTVEDPDPEWREELFGRQQVGPYEMTFVDGDGPGAIFQWLDTKGYAVTEAMRPLIDHYAPAEDDPDDPDARGGPRLQFLTLQLAPDAGVQDIAPIRLTFRGDAPMVPLVLSAVAASPSFEVLVFILGDAPYAPANQPDVTDDHLALVNRDERTLRDNWYGALAHVVREAGGEGWSVEYAWSTADLADALDGLSVPAEDGPEAVAHLAGVVDGHAFITRAFTIVAPGDLQTDPVFTPTGVERPLPLARTDSVCADTDLVPPPPCDRLSCGAGVCAEAGAPDWVGVRTQGCVCDPGAVARPVRSPATRVAPAWDAVVCQDTGFEPTAELASEMTDDPCANVSCGDLGACVVIGGMPACDCDEGTMAIALGDEQLACVPWDDVYAPEQIGWPGWPPPLSDCGDDDDSGGGFGDDDDDDDGGGMGWSGCSTRSTPPDPPEPRSWDCSLNEPVLDCGGCGACSAAGGGGGWLGLGLVAAALRRRRRDR